MPSERRRPDLVTLVQARMLRAMVMQSSVTSGWS